MDTKPSERRQEAARARKEAMKRKIADDPDDRAEKAIADAMAKSYDAVVQDASAKAALSKAWDRYGKTPSERSQSAFQTSATMCWTMWPGRDPALRLGLLHLLLPVRPPVRGGPASIDKPLVPEQVIGTTFTPAMPRKEDGQPDDRSGTGR